MADPKDPRLIAAIDLIRRTGADDFQLRYSDDEKPVVWMAVANYRVNREGIPVRHGSIRTAEATGALTPLRAVLRLLDRLMDGGRCAHCKRPTGVSSDFEGVMPLDELICWYVYDHETEGFRRGCEDPS